MVLLHVLKRYLGLNTKQCIRFWEKNPPKAWIMTMLQEQNLDWKSELDYFKDFKAIEAKLRARDFEYKDLKPLLLHRLGTECLTVKCPQSGLPMMFGNKHNHYSQNQ